MDAGEWLRGLGLGRYETVFSERAIGMDVLAGVTDGELARIGVRLGDRKRLLKAIASLPKPKTDAPPAEAPPPAGADAERRPITVLFCDLVGSTGIAARLDAEDWLELSRSYVDAASAAVARLGGRVQDRFGDGLMALFGHPRAQENDAERAVRAALAIQRALDDLNAANGNDDAPRLAARIGLDSGQVVVDASGAVFGEAPNIAARVQALAEPGSVLVTARVQRQVAGLFVAEDRGVHELKGVPAPAALYRIVRASGGGRRGRARAPTPLVGREEELERLGRRWERARAGEGQFVLVVGEPGIGKSRLIEAFHVSLGETPHTWVEWSSSQLLQNTPLHPVVEWSRARFGGADAPAGRRLADLEGALRSVGLDAAEYAPPLAFLVENPPVGNGAPRFAPEDLRRRQLEAITAWIQAGAKAQPVVLAFEDLHWADPTSLDLMRALAERGAEAPLFIIATARPEFRPPWRAGAHHSAVSLSPLDRGQVARMVGQMASRHALSPDVVDGVSERSGGVPLFVEELTRLLLERRVEGDARAIPPTLQQSLAARLDRLGPAREIAQIGAVLGRDFPYGLLAAVAGIEGAELLSALERLTEADVLVTESDGARAHYRFRHVLIQEAAYESLLKSRRRALHRRAAELLRDSPERPAAEPEAIARHFTEAGLDDLAIEWWGRAGDQALRRSAFQEAIAHLGKAIAMAGKAGGSPSANPRLARLHVAYGNALIAARGYGAPETTEAFARARESATGDKDATETMAAIYGLWLGGYVRGELTPMRTHARAFLDEVAARPASPEVAVAHRIAGITCWFAGGYREARDHFASALGAFQPGRDDDLAFRFGFDPGVGAMGYLAVTLWPLGEVDSAVSLIDAMGKRAAELTHVGTLAFARLQGALFELMLGRPARAESNVSELAGLAREHKLAFHGAAAAFLEGWVKERKGEPGGLEAMRAAMARVRGQNVLTFLDLGNIALAQAEARAGDPARALALLEEALATDERASCRAFEAELHRARGEILPRGDPARAENAFLAAIEAAKRQGTRGFELRGALALARLRRSAGRPAEARAVLAPALEGLSPTPAMPEIAEARALMEG